MNEKMKKFSEIKEEIIKELNEINNNIKQEDLKNASVKELAEYTKLTLEMQKKLMIIEALERSNNM